MVTVSEQEIPSCGKAQGKGPEPDSDPDARRPKGKFSKPPPTKSYCVVLIENAKAVASHKYNKPTAPKLMELNRLGYVKNVQLHTDSRTLLPRLKLLFLMLPSSVSTASEPSKSMAQTLAPVRDAGPGYKNIIFIALHPLAPNLPFPSVDVTLDSPDHDLTSANESSGSDDEMADDEGGGSSTGGVKQPSGTGTPMETATNDSQSRARSPPDDADGRKSASLFDPSADSHDEDGSEFPLDEEEAGSLSASSHRYTSPGPQHNQAGYAKRTEMDLIDSTVAEQLSVDILFAKLAKHVLVPLESLNALATHIRSVGEDAKSRAELRREFDKVFGPWSCSSLRQSLEDAFESATDAGNMKHAVVVGGEYGLRRFYAVVIEQLLVTIDRTDYEDVFKLLNDTSRALARKCANYVKSKPGPGAKPKPSPVPEDENGPRTRAQTAGAVTSRHLVNRMSSFRALTSFAVIRQKFWYRNLRPGPGIKTRRNRRHTTEYVASSENEDYMPKPPPKPKGCWVDVNSSPSPSPPPAPPSSEEQHNLDLEDAEDFMTLEWFGLRRRILKRLPHPNPQKRDTLKDLNQLNIPNSSGNFPRPVYHPDQNVMQSARWQEVTTKIMTAINDKRR
ncbi:hypothetical protein C8J57DRAFT_1226423 [Mycena rebaudengoi]|nr:hypothetical protein C8J57DRAFT_1226423 [Mycena rebaudengoi]